MNYVHLQVRSGYSFLNSTLSIDHLVKSAKEKGYDTVALTDEGVLHGAVSFYQTCKKYNVKPIIGLTLPIELHNQKIENWILLAKNYQGYQQLVQISTLLKTSTTTSVSFENMKQFLNHIIAIVPTTESVIGELLRNHKQAEAKDLINVWQKAFDDSESFYLGIQEHGLEQERELHNHLKQFHEQTATPVVAIQDVRYNNKEDAASYDCLQAIKNGNHWSQSKIDKKSLNRYLATPKEMYEIYREFWPEVLETSRIIADKCSFDMPKTGYQIPKYPVPASYTADSYLEYLCKKGLEHRYKSPSEKVMNRLKYELNVIKKMRFSDYFLIVWDFLKYSKQNKILTGPGRGSAAGSLVAYLLQITDVDPIKYNLLFERFLNPERITMPDIDIDFSDHRRDEVIKYVQKKYGADYVAQIITFGTFAARSLLRELLKTMGISSQESAFLLNQFPTNSSQTITEIIKGSQELASYIKKSEQLKVLFKVATRLEGLPRHISTHAAGVIISADPLTNKVPLTNGHDDVYLTQFPMNDLEALGLLKMDFLGLRNLSLMERVIASIRENAQRNISINQIPYQDAETFKLLQQGKTTGIFQLESQGMKNVLEKLHPTHFEDVVVVNALYRPGPMDFIPVYIKRKEGKEQINYPHTDLEPILKPTYGVLVYQEQIMQIVSTMAGFSLGQADLLRRAVSKKNKEMIEKQREAFLQGCLEKGYDQAIANHVYEWIVKFANYGFNRSHAVAYSMISYQLAYLKAHYPAYFMAELLSSVSNQQSKVRSYVKEAADLNITILAPSINNSFIKFTVEERNKIRMGLTVIKGVGVQAVEEILKARQNRPFKHLFDFCRRVSLKVVNRSVIEVLILAGSFDETYSNRATLLASIDQAMEQGELFSEFDSQTTLFEEDLELDVTYTETEPFTQLKALAFEKEVLGMYLSSHPLSTFRDSLRLNGYLSLNQLRNFIGKSNLLGCAVIQEVKTIRTKRGDPMAFLTLGDETEEMEAVIFPELYRQVNRWLKEEMIIFFKGKLEIRNDKMQWLINSISPFKQDELSTQPVQRLYIKLKEEEEAEQLTVLKGLAYKNPGSTPIVVYSPIRKETYQLAYSYWLNTTKNVLEQLKRFFGEDHVVLKSEKKANANN